MYSQSKISTFLSIIIGVILLIFSPTFLFSQQVGPDGSLAYTFKIPLPAGTGVQPDLALVYNSNTGNSFCGVGWSLSGLPSIHRDSSYPVNFNHNDHYIFSGQRLIYSPDDEYFHTEKESYVRIAAFNSSGSRIGPDADIAYWVITHKNGTKQYFGYTSTEHTPGNDGRIEAVGKNGKALAWALSRCEDVHGNYYRVDYAEDPENGDYYPAKLTYSLSDDAVVTVNFKREERPDHYRKYVPTLVDIDQRLQWINVRINGLQVRRYVLNYEVSASTKRCRLVSIQEQGRDGGVLPPVEFTWQDGQGDFTTKIRGEESAYFGDEYQSDQLLTGDFNGDGKTDVAYWGKHGNDGIECWRMHISTGNDFETRVWGEESAYFGNDYQSRQLLTGDFNNDGKTDIAYLGKDDEGTEC
jgi:hypothetical protein